MSKREKPSFLRRVVSQVTKSSGRSRRSGSIRRRRRCRYEQLEARRLLAAAVWNNVLHPTDVNGLNGATPLDALLVINELDRRSFSDPATGRLQDTNEDGQRPPFYDVNCDTHVSALDALLVINSLARPGEDAAYTFASGAPLDPSGGEGLVGSVTAAGCHPKLSEGDSLRTELSRNVTLTEASRGVELLFDAPQFDVASTGGMQDAFEVEITDSEGNRLISSFDTGRTVPFNWSESSPPASGTEAQLTVPPEPSGDPHSLLFDLSHLDAGTDVTVTARLVNNDADGQTSVIIRDMRRATASGGSSPNFASQRLAAAPGEPIRPGRLDDVTATMVPSYGRTSYTPDRSQIITELVVTNAGSRTVVGDLVVVFDGVSQIDTFPMHPDGLLPDGRPYFRLATLGDGPLVPGQSTQPRVVRFTNPGDQRFDFRLTTLGELNVAPGAFLGSPVGEIEAGRTFRYTAQATDDDGHELTYSIVSGPETMVIDGSSGKVSWLTTSDDVGRHSVTLRATDPFGLHVEQPFTIEVLASLQNRPPNFVSEPVTEAIASSGFEITTVGTGAGPSGIDVISGFRGPRLVTINADDQTVGVYAGENDDRFDEATEYATGQPKPTDIPFDVGYAVDVGLEPWTHLRNANSVHGLDHADFNGDGILDLAALVHDFDGVTRVDTYHFTVMIGDGNGQFAEPLVVGTFDRPTGATPSPRNLVAGDLNGDGHQDLIAAERTNSRLFVVLGKGDGTFEEMQTTTLPAAVSDFRLVDLDQDGNLDLVGRQNENHWDLGWWAGNGDGTFGEFRFIDTAGNAPGCCNGGQERPYDVADLNGDGLLDIVANDNRNDSDTPDNSGGEIRIYLANAPGSFEDPVFLDPPGPAFYYEGDWIRVADFTGDGHLDIAFVHVWHRTLELLVGDGSGVNFEQRTALSELNSRADNYAGGEEVADVDGDGDLDIILGSPFDNGSVQVLINDGEGNFRRQDYGSADFPTGVSVYSEINRNAVVGAMLGDYNRDGVMDFAYMTQGQDVNGVGIRLGTRPGEFGRSRSFAFTQDSGDSEVHPGDYDGDGIVDLLSLRSSQMLLGNGDGTFADPFPAYNVSRSGGSGATADFDRDGLTDIVATRANTRGSRYYVALSNGDGTLTVSDDQLVESSFYGYSAIKIDDFNNDGYPDFIAKASVERHVDVHLNDPDAPGTFTRSFRTTTVNNGVNVSNFDYSFATGDFNGDGFVDIAYGDKVTGEDMKIVILAGDGQGGFTQLTEVFAFADDFLDFSFYYPGDLQVGDVDEDGALDLVSFTTAGQRVIFGNGDGTFREAVDHYDIDQQGVQGRGPESYLIDLDGDGHLDIVEAAGQSTGIIRVRPGDGSGAFGVPRSVDIVQGAGPLAFADIDHDGKLDIVHVGTSSGGGGTDLPDAVVYAGKRDGLVDMLATDLNDDANEEVLAINEDSDRLTIYVGDNLGGLTRQPDLLTGRAPRAVTVADLDGDGRLELITANRAGRSLSVFSGSIAAGYTHSEFPAGNGVIDVEAGDLDDDGHVDLVALDDSSRALLVYAGNGTGELGIPTAIALGDKPGKLTLGDTNGDGIIDATITLPGSNRLMILPGDGQLGFGSPTYVELSESPSDVQVVDLNSDGNMDLVSSLPNANVIAVSYGLGRNQYSKSQQISVGEQPSRISLADADEDGRIDLIVSNRGDDSVSVIYNRFDPNEVYRYDSDAIDPDDDPLTYSIVDGPGGLIINAETGQLLWAASPDQVGEHEVTISADDGRGGVATQSFKVDVRPARENAPPLFASEPLTTLGANETLVYRAQSLDNDHDAVRYRLLDGPDGATIDPTTGLLEWDGRDVALRFGNGRQGGDVRVPDSESLSPESATIEQWFKLTDRERFATLIQTGRMYLRVNEFLTGIYLQIDFPDHNDQIRFTVPKQMEIERWYHLALTYDAGSGEAIVYLDGVPIGSGSSPTPQPLQFTTGAVAFVGNNNGTSARYLLDNYRMWDVARSADEVLEGLGTQYSDDPRLLIDYRFEDTETRTVSDSSGNLNDGYLTGNPLAPQRVPGLADAGPIPFAIAVEDGRGGYDQQSFVVNVLPELRGSISGTLFNDLNGNGLRDDGSEEGFDPELALAGWELFIDTNGNRYPDPSEPRTVTDADGSYVFDDLLPGAYSVRVSPVAGYRTPALIDAEVTANHARVHDVAIEQLALSQIRGQLRTEGGDAIAYWKAYADLNDNGTRDDGEPLGVSDRWGNFAIAGLAAGTYKVRTERPAGWRDDAGPHGLTVTLAADAIAADNDFVLTPTNTSVTDGIHFVTSPSKEIEAGETFRYASIAIGIRGDAISYDLSLAPDGMTIDRATGLIAWRPTIGQVGEHRVILRATSTSGSISLQDFTLDVAAPNTAPRFSTSPSLSAYATMVYASTIEAQDAEGDTLTYSVVDAPTGVALDTDSGELSWTPTTAQVGDHDFTLAVVDSAGNETRSNFRVRVHAEQPVKTPYSITSPRAIIGLGQDYVSRVFGVDQLGRELAWSLTSGPDGMSVTNEGSIRWRPSSSDLGEHVVVLSLTDADNVVQAYEFTVRVVGRPVNTPPQITSTAKLSAVIGSEYEYDLQFTDPEADTVALTLLRGPVGMSLHPSLGTLRWIPAEDHLGEHAVEVQVADAEGDFATQSFTVKASRSGGPPRITSVAATEAAVGAGYLYTVIAEDPEDDPLTYRLLAAPAGMTIAEATGEITWTPAAEQTGQQDVVIEVRDGVGGAATQAFAVRVSDGVPNLPPSITSTAPRFAAIGETYSHTVAAVDPEGTAITYSLSRSPDGMSVDASTGLIEWTPTAGQAGQFVVTLVATDAGGATGVESFRLDVLAQNHVPTITSTAPAEVVAGSEFTYQVVSTDADLDPLQFELSTAPGGATIDAFGGIRWTPDTLGSFDFVVRVSDPRGGQAMQSFSIDVVADTIPPVVSVIERPENTSRNVLPWQGPFTVYVRGIDNVGLASLTLSANGQDVPLDAAGTAKFTFEDWTFQAITATATAVDTSGNVTARTITFDYDFPEGWSGAGTSDIPTATISSPAEAEAVFGMVKIVGTAAHDDFDEYRLSYRRVDESSYTEFHSSRAAVTDGELGVWDTSLLANDEYVIRLEVATAGGVVNVAEHRVGLSGELKLGNFRLSFTDMVIPIAGIPIEITRIYDTLQAHREGDFGYGWRLEYRDTDLRVGVPNSGLEDIGIYSPLRPGVKVYLNVPGQGRQGFTFDPEIRVLPGFGGENLVLARPRFTPDPGVSSTLSSGTSGYLRLNERGELFAPGNLPYNPASPDFGGAYVLTTEEGVTYRIDGSSGKLTSAQNANGVSVTFSDASVSDENGLSLDITRDARGRITAITDPEGGFVRYRYNGGDLAAVIDPLGNEVKYRYDPAAAHRLVDVVDPLGQTGVRTEYDDRGRLMRQVSEITENNVAFTHELEDGRTRIGFVDGSESVIRYDNRGRPLEITDNLGRTASNEYGPNGLVRTTNPLGEVTAYERNPAGQILKVTNADGTGRRYTYDSRGRRLTETDEMGRTSRFSYDERGNLIEIRVGDQVTTFERDARGNLLAETRPDGSLVRNSYDAQGFITQSTDAIGLTVHFNRDSLGRELGQQATNRLANGDEVSVSVARQFDAAGNLTKLTDSMGGEVNQTRDAVGNLASITDQTGRTLQYRHEGTTLLQGVTFGDGTEVSYTYDAQNNVTAMADRGGRVTEFVYDAAGNQVEHILPDETPETNADNPRTRFEYDALNRPIATVDPLGHRVEQVYDSRGRVVTRIDPFGNETHFEYDASGALVKETDAAGRSTRYSRDRFGNVLSIRYPDGSTESFEYDTANRLVRYRDPSGDVHQRRYDDAGRLTEVVDGLGRVTRYTYDLLGNLVSREDAGGNRFEYTYNELNLLTSVRRPDGRVSTRSYRADGKLVAETDFAGESTAYVYDERGYLVEKLFADGSFQQFAYDATGNLIAITDPSGTARQEFDDDGRLVSRTDRDGEKVEYDYDVLGRRTEVTVDGRTTDYRYDAVGRVSEIVSGGESVARYSYDQLGNVSEIAYGSGVREVSEYDSRSRLIRREWFDGADELLDRRTYRYDAAGRLIEDSRSDGSTRRFQYDANSQLVQYEVLVGQSAPSRTVYTYDVLGNAIGRVVDGVPEVTQFDALGQAVQRSRGGVVTEYVYDENGNLVETLRDGVVVRQLTWDARGRLVSVADVNEGESRQVDYEYDWAGLLKTRTEDGERFRFHYDRSQSLPKLIMASDGTLTEHFVHGSAIVAREQHGERFFYHADAAGNTIAQTDGEGGFVEQVDYAPFGEVEHSVLATNGSGALVNYGFASEPLDATTGMTYLRQRHYDAALRQFVSPDPYAGDRAQPLSQQPYVYALNSPLNYHDPSGEIAVPSLAELQVAGSIAATVSAVSAIQVLAGMGGLSGGHVGFQGPLVSFGVGVGIGVEFSSDLYAGLLASDVSFVGGPASAEGYRLSIGSGATFGTGIGLGAAFGLNGGAIDVGFNLNPVTRFLGGAALSGAMVLADVSAQFGVGETPRSYLALGFAKGNASGGSAGLSFGGGASYKTGVYVAISIAINENDADYIHGLGEGVGANRLPLLIDYVAARYL